MARLRRAGVGWVLGAFVVSRVAAALAGVRFDDSSLATTWQFVDPELLRHDLWPSVWYSHTQPPLFNLVVGVVLRWSPLSDQRSFQLLFLSLGVGLTLGVLVLLRTLGARRWVAIVATVVITCSPSALLYENWIFYTYPMALLVVVDVVALARWVRTGRLRWLAGVCAVTGTMVLSRSLFHPVWFALVVVLALVLRHPPRRQLAGAAIAVVVPLALIGLVVVKNQVLFGSPSVSTWTGMNLERMTTEQLPTDLRQALVDQGTLSPQANVLAFFPYSAYEGVVLPCQPAHPDVPVLANPDKPDGGPNFNYECFQPVFDQAQRDALAAIPHAKGAIVRAQVASWQFSLQPSSGYTFLDRNRPAIGSYEKAYNRLVLGEVDVPTVVTSPPNVRALYTSPRPLALTIALALIVVVVSAGAAALRCLRRRTVTPADAALVLIGLTTLWVFVVGNALEIGENARFRWIVEPVMLAVLAVALQHLIERLLARRRR